MKSRTVRALPTTLGVLVVAAAAIFAASVAAASPPAETAPLRLAGDDDGTPDQGPGDATTQPGDDDGTPDQGPGDATRWPRDDDGAAAAIEDRPLRTEISDDGDRREVRTEVAHTGTRRYAAASAGTVTLERSGASLTIGDVSPSAGWTHVVERPSGYEVEVTFRGDGGRVDFTAEIEGDRVEVRVRER